MVAQERVAARTPASGHGQFGIGELLYRQGGNQTRARSCAAVARKNRMRTRVGGAVLDRSHRTSLRSGEVSRRARDAVAVARAGWLRGFRSRDHDDGYPSEDGFGRGQARRRRSDDRGMRQGRRDDRAEDGDDARVHRDGRGSGKPPALRRTLDRALPQSFNAITVDGDMSTNDTLLLMAQRRGGESARSTGRDLAASSARSPGSPSALARELVRDGEGATKLVTVEVRGARPPPTRNESPGRSPIRRWSRRRFSAAIRISDGSLMAVGKAGVALDLERIEVSLGGIKHRQPAASCIRICLRRRRRG